MPAYGISLPAFGVIAALFAVVAILAYLGGYMDGWKARDRDWK